MEVIKVKRNSKDILKDLIKELAFFFVLVGCGGVAAWVCVQAILIFVHFAG